MENLESIVNDEVLQYLSDSDDEEQEEGEENVDERALRRMMSMDESDEEDDEEDGMEEDKPTTTTRNNKKTLRGDEAKEYIADDFEEQDINTFLDDMEKNMDALDEMDYDENEKQNNREEKRAMGELYGDEDIDEDEEEDEEPRSGKEQKSAFELEQERLLERMEELENKNIRNKDWQEIGEVDAKKRPMNSLVEEGKLSFEHAHKAKPVITEEITKDLESIIISRIVSGIYDDPVKLSDEDKNEDLKQDIQLEHEKSKKSLAQIYEEMYLKKVEGVDIEEEKKEDPVVKATKQKVLKQVSDLLRVLNQMSSFTYVAPPRIDLEDESENKTVTNTVTGKEEGEKNANEILPAVKWLPQAGEEMTEQDKKRKRRQFKETTSKKAKKANELVDKLNPGASSHATKLLDDINQRKDNTKKEKASKLEDASAVESDKMFGSSKQFFNKIQDNIRKIHGAKAAKKEKSGVVNNSKDE